MTNRLIQIAYGLTEFASHAEAVEVLTRHTDIGPLTFFRHDTLRDAEIEAQNWAHLWAAARDMWDDGYDELVQDARVYLREHLDELSAWESQMEGDEHASTVGESPAEDGSAGSERALRLGGTGGDSQDPAG